MSSPTSPPSPGRYTRIRYELTPQAIWITLARPEKLNLVDDILFEELYDAFIRARLDADHSVVVLRGSGPMFSGGGDLGADIAQQALDPTEDFIVDMYRHVQAEYPIFNAMETCPQTIVAALNGDAYGAAVDIAMLCDLVIAVRGAKMVFAPGKWGLADTPNATRLTKRIGISRTKDLLYTARELTTEEAERFGIVTRLCDRDEFDTAIVAYVEEILATSPDARRAMKDVIRRQLPPFSPEEHFVTAVGEDFRAGVRAFMKREPAPWTAAALTRRAQEQPDT